MIYSDHYLPPTAFTQAPSSKPLNTHTSASDQATETKQKGQSCSSRIQHAVRSAFYFIVCNLHRLDAATNWNIFSGKKLTRTHNAGKAGDRHKYAEYKHTAFRVSDETAEQLANNGFKPPQRYIYKPNTYFGPAPSEGILLSPDPVDDGKCTGGVTLFLDQVLHNVPLDKIADNFSEGVPFEGVMHQELYNNFPTMGSFDSTLVEVWAEKCVMQNVSLEQPTEIVDPEHPREARIISAYIQYLVEKPEQNLIDWVDERIQMGAQAASDSDKQLYKPLEDSEKVTLYAIASKFQYGTDCTTRLILEVNGLKVEPITSKTISYISKSRDSADAVLDRVEDLTEGAYKLDFPVYNQWSQLRGHHTIAFNIDNHGTTTFYDPNFSITQVEEKDRRRAVEKVFKYYSGYTAPGKKSYGSYVKNILIGRANPPENASELTSFRLMKVNLA